MKGGVKESRTSSAHTSFWKPASFLVGVGVGLPPGEQVSAECHTDAGHLKGERSVCISLASEGWLTD